MTYGFSYRKDKFEKICERRIMINDFTDSSITNYLHRLIGPKSEILANIIASKSRHQ